MKAARFKERKKAKSWMNFQICVQRRTAGCWGHSEGRSCIFFTQKGLNGDLQVMLQSRERSIRMAVLKGADN